MMQADIIAVAHCLFAAASFWPTSGSSGALAKWNSSAHTANTSNGRLPSRTRSPCGSRLSSCSCRSAPRARSWSIAAAGIESVASVASTAHTGTSRNTARCENR